MMRFTEEGKKKVPFLNRVYIHFYYIFTKLNYFVIVCNEEERKEEKILISTRFGANMAVLKVWVKHRCGVLAVSVATKEDIIEWVKQVAWKNNIGIKFKHEVLQGEIIEVVRRITDSQGLEKILSFSKGILTGDTEL